MHQYNHYEKTNYRPISKCESKGICTYKVGYARNSILRCVYVRVEHVSVNLSPCMQIDCHNSRTAAKAWRMCATPGAACRSVRFRCAFIFRVCSVWMAIDRLSASWPRIQPLFIRTRCARIHMHTHTNRHSVAYS